jgi:hypothetical protein
VVPRSRRNRSGWVLLLGAVLVLAALALQAQRPRGELAQVAPVTGSDQEIAWVQTATATGPWERLIAGVRYTCQAYPELRLHYDDSAAFSDSLRALPELVIRRDGYVGALRVRWYKLTSDLGNDDWVAALARRKVPPLAIIGGATTDRAIDLARSLRQQAGRWPGHDPLLFITTATTDTFQAPGLAEMAEQRQALMAIYPGRSFRFCFTNMQMAQAVLDFVWSRPELRPHSAWSAWQVACLSTAPLLAAALPPLHPASSFGMYWNDDDYSENLNECFRQLLTQTAENVAGPSPGPKSWLYQPIQPVVNLRIPHSIGGFNQPNTHERQAVVQLLAHLRPRPGDRSLLILPASTNQTRRVLRTLLNAAPFIGQHLVVVTGDSISLNTLYRDADLLWDVRSLPIPLVGFAHHNPAAWTSPDERTSTEEVLLNVDLFRTLAESAFVGGQLLAQADDLRDRLSYPSADAREQSLAKGKASPVRFDRSGNRDPTCGGQFIIYLRPNVVRLGPHLRHLHHPRIEIHQRNGKGWELIRLLPLDGDAAAMPRRGHAQDQPEPATAEVMP